MLIIIINILLSKCSNMNIVFLKQQKLCFCFYVLKKCFSKEHCHLFISVVMLKVKIIKSTWTLYQFEHKNLIINIELSAMWSLELAWYENTNLISLTQNFFGGIIGMKEPIIMMKNIYAVKYFWEWVKVV